MKKYFTLYGCVHVIMMCCMLLLFLTDYIHAEKINVSAMIRDSLSTDSLPLVTVTVVNLGQSFKTTRSSFYIALPAGIYDFRLEAEGYEPLKKAIDIRIDGERFVLDMVKISDRIMLEQQRDSVNIYLGAFSNAIENGEILKAGQYLAALDTFGYPQAVRDSVHRLYEKERVAYIDSLLIYSQSLEDSGKASDAYYYYNKIISIDSLNETALKKCEEFNKPLTLDNKIVTNDAKPSEVIKMSDQEIEKLYNSAIDRFLNEDYDRALALFKTILKHQPNHEGAKNYLSRTEARLKFTDN